jgi:hypothetical protein
MFKGKRYWRAWWCALLSFQIVDARVIDIAGEAESRAMHTRGLDFRPISPRALAPSHANGAPPARVSEVAFEFRLDAHPPHSALVKLDGEARRGLDCDNFVGEKFGDAG